MRLASTLPARDGLALLGAIFRYWPRLDRVALGELRRWEGRAEAIPDPVLRAQALAKLRDQRANPRAASTVATLVDRPRRVQVARLTLAFQVLDDYLDVVSEQSARDPLANGRQVHRALRAIFDPEDGSIDYYRHHPRRDDGGYVHALVATCRTLFHALPASAIVGPVARAAAERCGEAQARSHAVASLGAEQLAEWARTQARGTELEWWELAAAGASSLSLHALFGAAADPKTTPTEAAIVEAAYYPYVDALAILLDSLADHPWDRPGVDHSFIGYYPTDTIAAERLAAIASQAAAAVRRLPRGSRHLIIVAGIAGYYLSHAGPAREDVFASLGPICWPIVGLLRLPRIVHTHPDSS